MSATSHGRVSETSADRTRKLPGCESLHRQRRRAEPKRFKASRRKPLLAKHWYIVTDKSPVKDHFVSVFWNEIKSRYNYREFVKDPSQSKLGIGLLMLDK